MLWPLLLLAVVLLVLLYLHLDSSPLDSIKGPLAKPILGNVPLFFNTDSRGMFVILRELANKYGDRYLIKIFRRRILHITTPDDIEVVLSHSKNISKSKPYKFLQPWLGTGLLLSTGSKWHIRRRILTPTFHFNILKNFAPIIEEKSRNLVSRLEQEQGKELNIFPIISDFTIYTICETAMGTQLDQDKSASTMEYKSAILEIGSQLLYRLVHVWLHVDFIFKNSEIGKKFQKTLIKVHSFADKVILERKKKRTVEDKNEIAAVLEGEDIGSKRRLAMLDLLLEAESKGEIDLEGIREEVNTFMFEGHDTTAAALTFALMLLADHEEVQERVYEEVKSILGHSTAVATSVELSNMRYLEAVIKETLRMYPSVPFIAREITEDFVMGDLKIPKGTEVAIHIYDLHHREELFPDPYSFRPERFINAESRHPYGFVPFSAGPRNCIGQRFAMQEMKCVLSEICRNFKLSPKSKGWRPKLVSDLVLRSNDPIYVTFSKR